jgi:hypothetical protein
MSGLHTQKSVAYSILVRVGLFVLCSDQNLLISSYKQLIHGLNKNLIKSYIFLFEKVFGLLNL